MSVPYVIFMFSNCLWHHESRLAKFVEILLFF